MDRLEIINKIAAAAEVEIEYHSLKLGDVSVVCQLKGMGTLCWSEIDEETCAASITRKQNGKIETLHGEFKIADIVNGNFSFKA